MKSIWSAVVILAAGTAAAQEWTAPGENGPWLSEVVRVDGKLAMVNGPAEGGVEVRMLGSGEVRVVARDDLKVRVRFAPVTSNSDVRVGQTIEVEWNGSWYQARVLDKGPEGLKIHYRGWASSWEEVIEHSRARLELRWAVPRAIWALEDGTPVEVRGEDGTWSAASVVAKTGENAYRVRLADGSEEEVAGRRLRYETCFLGNYPAPMEGDPPGAPATADSDLSRGTVVAANDGSGWDLALVRRAGPDGVLVRWMGYPPSWDETLPLDKIRAGFALEDAEERPASR